MSTDGHRRLAPRSDAFTLPELIVGVLVSGSTLAFGVGIVLAAQRSLPGRYVEIHGVNLAIAPSPGVFADAVRLHGQLMERVNSARAVYVFGGDHVGLPAAAAPRNGGALQLSTLPRLNLSQPGALPSDAWGFYQKHRSALGPTEASPQPEDFSAIVIGAIAGQLDVTALVQVRSEEAIVGTGPDEEHFIRREVRLWDAGVGVLEYRFVERRGTAALAEVGAQHFWYRYSEPAAVAEEGATLAVFPDPWLYGGSSSGDVVTAGGVSAELPPFSRFSYFLGVDP